ncbi:MAG: GPW/gp25 family protein [Nitrospira sp.]
MDQNRDFLGTGWSFPPEFHRGFRSVKMVSWDEDIRESLRILLTTSPGERILQPAYGCGLHALAFENVSEGVKTEIKDLIDRAVLFFEPRITLNRIDIDDTDQYEGLLKLYLDYTIRTTNTRSNMVYPFYFIEGTNIKP